MYQPPLYYLIAAASLSACKLSINDSTSVLVLRLIRSILRHCSIRFGLFEFAARASAASRLHRTFAGGVSADAFVSRALCDERIIVGYAVHSGALSLFASC